MFGSQSSCDLYQRAREKEFYQKKSDVEGFLNKFIYFIKKCLFFF